MIAVYNPDKNMFLSPMADGPLKFVGSLAENNMAVENISKFGRDFSVVRVPYSLKLLIQELQCANVVMRIITEDNIEQIENMTFSKNINILLGEKEVDMNKYIEKMNKQGKKTGVRKDIMDDGPITPSSPLEPPPNIQVSPEYALEPSPYFPASLWYREKSPQYVPVSPTYEPTTPPYAPPSPRYAPTTPPYGPPSPRYEPTTPPYAPDSPMNIEEFQGSLSSHEITGGRSRDYEIGDLVCKNGKYGEVFCVTKKGDEFLTIEKQTGNMPTLDDLQVVDRSEISRYYPQQRQPPMMQQMYQPMDPMQQMPFIPQIPSEQKSTPDVNITLVTGNNNKVTGGEQTKKAEDIMKEPIIGGATETKVEAAEPAKEESSSGVFDFAKSFFIKKTG
jgi:hypothetical protein